jgi:hypothetical protein
MDKKEYRYHTKASGSLLSRNIHITSHDTDTEHLDYF